MHYAKKIGMALILTMVAMAIVNRVAALKKIVEG